MKLLTTILLLSAACGGTEGASPDAGGSRDAEHCQPSAADVPVAFDSVLLLPDLGLSMPSAATHVRAGQLWGSSSPELIVSEPSYSRISIVHGCAESGCSSVELSAGLEQPLRTAIGDMDGDGDADIVIADIGSLATTDDEVGSVHLAEQLSPGVFEVRLLVDQLRRVSCVETADLDGDGDLDVALCVFGDLAGEVAWLQRTESGSFQYQTIERRPGAVNAVPVDVDGDDDLDIVAAFAQLEEVVMLYRNDGAGAFTGEELFAAGVSNYGISGLEAADIDGDGDADLLLSNGDMFDYDYPDDTDALCSLYGLTLFENDGTGAFSRHRIVDLVGAYSPMVADLDGDDDLDVVLASYHDRQALAELEPGHAVWLRNDGGLGFTRFDIPQAAPNTVAMTAADVDADGDMDLLGSSLDLRPPFGHRLLLLRNDGPLP